MQISIRKAMLAEVPALEALIQASARGLRQGYSAEQVESALGNALGVDRQLIRDGTYFVVEVGLERVACGGWSKRKTLFGSDHGPVKDHAWLNPANDPAR